ncbi:helix-turn-helix domain-containing protein [Chengkuizengella marina]|uniref:Helix-turn-helix domain-containing protein n=1 Tax=Chengkuizengella marina TaxID=2507566 RepID=A0A6N9Q2K8_9BACL|nr:helix-turn-helix domain-containing protein [Chengkuizengella marina]NBI28588.1 helix-turn-helix domain-containing protein [Chengkuizengella marina]
MKIKSMRLQNNVSQKELSKFLNISSVQISRYESGERKPSSETLEKIADFFNVSTDYLLGRSSKYLLDYNLSNETTSDIINDVEDISYLKSLKSTKKENTLFIKDIEQPLTDEEANHLQEQLKMFRLLKQQQNAKKQSD